MNILMQVSQTLARFGVHLLLPGSLTSLKLAASDSMALIVEPIFLSIDCTAVSIPLTNFSKKDCVLVDEISISCVTWS